MDTDAATEGFENPRDGAGLNVQAERSKILLIGGLFLLLLAAVMTSLVVGMYRIPPRAVGQVLLTCLMSAEGFVRMDSLHRTIVWDIRLPRILLSVVVGFSLSCAGVVFQGCFRNPLVEPYILGVSSGAAFGAALAIVFPLFFLSLHVSAFFFGTAAVFVSYFLARTGGRTPVVTLILSGVIVSSIFAALVSVLQYLAVDAALREIVFWLMGGFYYASWTDVSLLYPVFIASFLVLQLLSWKLNILSLGDEEARSLGVHPERYKVLFVVIGTLLTAISVSAVGIVAWIGLMMPHMARMLVGPDHRFTLPASAFMGGIYLVICDTLARTMTSAEIPVGIITSILGAPYLAYLLRNKKNLLFQG
jgi:iron complex transport system permease protein